MHWRQRQREMCHRVAVIPPDHLFMCLIGFFAGVLTASLGWFAMIH